MDLEMVISLVTSAVGLITAIVSRKKRVDFYVHGKREDIRKSSTFNDMQNSYSKDSVVSVDYDEEAENEIHEREKRTQIKRQSREKTALLFMTIVTFVGSFLIHHFWNQLHELNSVNFQVTVAVASIVIIAVAIYFFEVGISLILFGGAWALWQFPIPHEYLLLIFGGVVVVSFLAMGMPNEVVVSVFSIFGFIALWLSGAAVVWKTMITIVAAMAMIIAFGGGAETIGFGALAVAFAGFYFWEAAFLLKIAIAVVVVFVSLMFIG
ncbi:hypothetical protein [Candidatus Uabimicrobium sp. HlEnr_7]|uniref:hypothetical protein n=1 Tax=Candidatus Uabimicrobium helgolandensis TaxID=3095367 RepID=UPI0035578538